MWGLRLLAAASAALICATAALICATAALICATAAWGGFNAPPPAGSDAPQWLADGHHLVYRGIYVFTTPSEVFGQFVAADDGSGFRRAAAGDVAARPDVARSPDGSRIAFVTGGELWTSAPDGSAPEQVTQGAAASSDLQPPSWSPDGSKIAFACCGTGWIDVVDADGSGLHRVHRGATVAWISATSLAVGLDGYATTIYRVGADGRNARPLVTGYRTGRIDISPDGTQIAFSSPVGWAYDSGDAVYVADTSGLDEHVRLVSPTVCSVESKLGSEPHGRCVNGTSGADLLVGSRIGDLFVAGPGNDVIRAGNGQNIVQAQWGDDTISSGPQIDFIDGGAGNDQISSGAGNDRVNPGPGNDVVHAGTGNDIVVANDGARDAIDCGLGEDRVLADRVDVLTSCEHVTYLSPDPDQR